TYEGEGVSHTFKANGSYDVTLSVTDEQGGVGKTNSRVYVGNTPPTVQIETTSNRTFYWAGSALDYNVEISDAEEEIDMDRASVSFGYVPNGKDAAIVLTSGQDASGFQYLKGQSLVSSLDCRSCHSIDQESVG